MNMNMNMMIEGLKTRGQGVPTDPKDILKIYLGLDQGGTCMSISKVCDVSRASVYKYRDIRAEGGCPWQNVIERLMSIELTDDESVIRDRVINKYSLDVNK